MNDMVEEQQETEVKSSEFADSLNIAESTVRKYAQILETEGGYVFKKDVSGARVFRKKDFDVYKNMMDYRNKVGVNLKQAARVAATTETDVIQTTRDVHKLTPKVLQEKLSDMKDVIQTTQIEMQKDFERKLLANRENNIGYELNKITKRRKFKVEAAKEWNKKPENERYRRTGFWGLFKEEDITKRTDFIDSYVEEKMIDYLENELNTVNLIVSEQQKKD